MPMPPRPTLAADSDVLAPGYAANAHDSAHHHNPGSGPPATIDPVAQPGQNQHQHHHQAHHALSHTPVPLQDPAPYQAGEAHATVADTAATDYDYDYDYDEDNDDDDVLADAAYDGADDSNDVGHAHEHMTGTGGGGGGSPWNIPQATTMEPMTSTSGDLMGFAPFGLLPPMPFYGQDMAVDVMAVDVAAHFQPPLHTQSHFSAELAASQYATAAAASPGPQAQQGDDGALGPDLPQPPVVSNSHFGPLSPENLDLMDFLTYWARLGNFSHRMRTSSLRVPHVSRVADEAARRRPVIRLDDLLGDELDPQGIDWRRMGITRGEARERRHLTYRNYVNKTGSDKWRPTLPDTVIPGTENYFRFSRMDVRQNVHLSHFQLRNLLACAGQTHAFYPGRRAVHRLNPLSGQSEVAMNLSDISHPQISTLDAGCGVVVAGLFTGEYCMRGIHSADKGHVRGQITTSTNSGITNHLQIHRGRGSDGARVAFSSNDQGYRVMDVATGRFILDTRYPFPMNCSAVSADRRLRVLVGDSYESLIVNAETGEVVQRLRGHRDYGFACDWSDDGWTVATAAQDRGVKIWDARRWTDSSGRCTPLTTLRTEMAGARGLRFSPIGSGPRVLVATEEADFVNVIDAQTFRRKQTFDIFGEIGGVEFSDEGRTLNVLCCDRNRGGLVQLDRHDYGPCWGTDEGAGPERRDAVSRRLHFGPGPGPMPGPASGPGGRAPQPVPKRRRLYLDGLEPF